MAATLRKVTTSLSLPTNSNVPPTELTDYNQMIYGRKQWGKSTLFTQFPDSLHLQFEPGRRGISAKSVWPRSYSEAVEYVGLFIDSDYRAAIFDTIDRFYDMMLREECLVLSGGEKDHPGKFGKEGYQIWDYVKTKFEQIFIDIIDSGKQFLLISHDKKVEQKDRDGKEWVRVEPTCKPAAWKIAQSMCDFVYHGDFLDGSRIITVRDLDNTTLASCNPDIECYLDPEGKPLRRFQIPNVRDAAFTTLEEAFYNKHYDVDFTPPKKPLPKKAVALKS